MNDFSNEVDRKKLIQQYINMCNSNVEWFCDFKIIYDEDHERIMKLTSLLTLIISTFIHIINGCKHNGGQYEVNFMCFCINLVSIREVKFIFLLYLLFTYI